MNTNSFVAQARLREFSPWEKLGDRRVPYSFDLEITARCNNDCRHCYINLPAGDVEARRDELSVAEISDIADQAVALGSLWCLITGGEPLLRQDWADVYMTLKRKGLLVSLFTNACLVSEEHAALFEKYPPRDVEVTVYGATEETYERVTRRQGSYRAFRRGLDLLLESGVRVRLKAMALRDNVAELPEIARFCRERTVDYYRFDPVLHLRFDGNPVRNDEIKAERLSPAEIVELEQSDPERMHSLEKSCDRLIQTPGCVEPVCNHLFHCGAGNANFVVGYEGTFRLCASLCAPGTTYDLRRGTLAEAWNEFVPRVRDTRARRAEFLTTCRTCNIVNLCLHCPAHAALETGAMDGDTPYFCAVAHARADMLRARQPASGLTAVASLISPRGY